MSLNRLRSSLHFALIVVVLLGFMASPAQAARAGIVIDFGNGQVVTECVHFGGPMITAFDLLQRSGVAFTFENFGSLGAAICSVENVGCQFPAQECFCQCTGTGPCNFFAFYTLQNGQFVLSDVGVSSAILHNKDVIALSFGDASTAPAPLTIKDICKDGND